MAEKRELHKQIECSIDRWTQSSSFFLAFASRPLASYCFTRPVAKLFKTRMNETFYKWSLAPKAEEFPPAGTEKTWPQPSASLKFSDESDCQNTAIKTEGPVCQRWGIMQAKQSQTIGTLLQVWTVKHAPNVLVVTPLSPTSVKTLALRNFHNR